MQLQVSGMIRIGLDYAILLIFERQCQPSKMVLKACSATGSCIADEGMDDGRFNKVANINRSVHADTILMVMHGLEMPLSILDKKNLLIGKLKENLE